MHQIKSWHGAAIRDYCDHYLAGMVVDLPLYQSLHSDFPMDAVPKPGLQICGTNHKIMIFSCIWTYF
jgi:hypothetical protein